MAVHWNATQEIRVRELIGAYPVDSGRCAELARGLLPIAREHDPSAHALLIRPVSRFMRFVVPRVVLDEPWDHHVTTAVEAHCVDALTGVPGAERERYLGVHFEHADALRVERFDLEVG